MVDELKHHSARALLMNDSRRFFANTFSA